MNAYLEMSAVNSTRPDTVQWFALAPEDKWVPPDVEMHMGPWGWQWRDGMRDLASASPSPIRITIKALMDGIEKVGILERTCI